MQNNYSYQNYRDDIKRYLKYMKAKKEYYEYLRDKIVVQSGGVKKLDPLNKDKWTGLRKFNNAELELLNGLVMQI